MCFFAFGSSLLRASLLLLGGIAYSSLSYFAYSYAFLHGVVYLSSVTFMQSA